MGRKGDARLRRFVADVVEIGAFAIRGRLPTIGDDLAKDVATEIANELCERHGKSNFYVPENYEPLLTRRDEALLAALERDSATARRYSLPRLREVAQEFKLSERQVYNIQRLGAQRASKQAQPGLPGIPEPQSA